MHPEGFFSPKRNKSLLLSVCLNMLALCSQKRSLEWESMKGLICLKGILPTDFIPRASLVNTYLVLHTWYILLNIQIIGNLTSWVLVISCLVSSFVVFTFLLVIDIMQDVVCKPTTLLWPRTYDDYLNIMTNGRLLYKMFYVMNWCLRF